MPFSALTLVYFQVQFSTSPIEISPTNVVQGNKKDSFYYVYTTKEILQDTSFVCEVESSNPKVRVFKYETKEGKARYAVWCPSSNSTKVKRFKLNVGEGDFILAELAFERYNGKRSDLKNKDGNVTFCASEMPVFIIEK